MNPRNLLALLLAGAALAVLGGCSSTASSRIATHQLHGFGLPFTDLPAGLETETWTRQLEPGNTRDAVLAQLGMPEAALGHDVWIYGYAQSPDRDLRTQGLDTLVVAFSGERVSRLRLVNGGQLKEMIARFEKGGGLPATAVAQSL